MREKGVISIALFVIAILFLSGSIIGGSYYIKTQYPQILNKILITNNNSPSATPIIQPTVIPTSSPLASQANNEVNPLTPFSGAFSASDFKILSSGKFEISSTNTKINLKSNIGTGSAHTSSSINQENGLYFTQKGNLVRNDDNNPVSAQITFLKGQDIYSLNPKLKKYSQYNITSTSAQGPWSGANLYALFKQSFIPINLLDDNKSLIWNKVGNNEWQTDWIFKTPFNPQGTPVKVKITLDPKTNLMTVVSLKAGDIDPTWHDLGYNYQPISNIDSYLVVSSDYSINQQQ